MESKIKRSGLCISGMTIRKAIINVVTATKISEKVVVNLGSIDIMHGRELMDIIADYKDLIYWLKERKIKYLLTTVAPIANRSYHSALVEKIILLNNWIKRNCRNTIDLWTASVNLNLRVDYSLYDEDPKVVSGSSLALLLWSQFGRNKFIKAIRNEITKVEFDVW